MLAHITVFQVLHKEARFLPFQEALLIRHQEVPSLLLQEALLHRPIAAHLLQIQVDQGEDHEKNDFIYCNSFFKLYIS